MKTSKIIAMLLSLACSTGLLSCSDDSVREPLANPVVTHAGASYESLSFKWDAVAGAVQYGYRLSDPNLENVIAGVTQQTEASFTGLRPATAYTLEVWPFAAIDGNYSTPPAVTLTATTDALIKLATPALSVDDTADNVVISWEAVADAQAYSYTIFDANNAQVASGNTTKTGYTVTGLPSGDYRFSLTATNSKGGYEESNAATVSFTIAIAELWRAQGSYYSIELNSSWPATIVAYSNSTFKILSFYGVDGYDMEFAINNANSNDSFSFINGRRYEENGYKYWLLDTGVDVPAILYTYPWDNYSYYDGNAATGEVGIGLYYGDAFDWGYDVFTWGSVGAAFDIETLVGTYNNYIYGEEAIYSADFTPFDYDNYIAQITKTGDNTVSIDGIYWLDCPVTGTVNATDMTITITAQTYGGVYDNGERYIFANKDDVTAPVVARINDDGSITIPDLGIWYEYNTGEIYNYLFATSDLIKQEGSSSARAKCLVRPAGAPVRR